MYIVHCSNKKKTSTSVLFFDFHSMAIERLTIICSTRWKFDEVYRADIASKPRTVCRFELYPIIDRFKSL